jgi:hypothetical protein
MRKPPKSIQCRWCLQPFKDDESRATHTESCLVKLKVQKAERDAGRQFGFNETMAVRDRARKEVAMDREFQDLKN